MCVSLAWVPMFLERVNCFSSVRHSMLLSLLGSVRFLPCLNGFFGPGGAVVYFPVS